MRILNLYAGIGGNRRLWSNFEIAPFQSEASNIRSKNKISDFEYDLSKYKLSDKRQVLRNCVSSLLGQHVLHNAPNKACSRLLLQSPRPKMSSDKIVICQKIQK